MFQRVPQIEITAPYRVIEMDLKKITAFVMLILLTLSSLTMVVMADDPIGDPDDGAGMAGAIERAYLYLDKVRASVENLAGEYPDDEAFQGYRDEIYDLLGQGGEEEPEILLETTGDVGDGDEARIVIPMPDGFTLGDLEALSWSEFLEYGYPPHVDVILDMGEGATDALVFEYAYNYESHAAETWPTYDALTGDWYQTFSDDGEGPSVITDASNAWLSSGAPGPLTGAPTFYYHTLGEWKSPGYEGVSSDTPVLRLEIEVDNWIAQTKAYIDDIKIDGVTYDHLGAEGFLDRASAYHDEGDINSAARCLASARNILGRVNGLLTSMAKTHKVARTVRFMEQFRHRIGGLEDKVNKLRLRLGAGNANKFKASMGLARGKLGQLDEDPGNNVDSIIDGLENMTGIIGEGFDGLEEGETSNTLEAMDRLEAHIRVLKASAERLRVKGYNTTAVDVELADAEALLNDMMNSLVGSETDEAEGLEGLIEETEEIVSGVKGKIKEIRKGQQNKGGNGKGKGG